MRIVESRAIVLTVRPPRLIPETIPPLAPPPRVAAPIPRPHADPIHATRPEAGFVMQLIATAAAQTEPDPPATPAAGLAYGDAGRATSSPRSGGLVARSI
ncbi:MAG: hypothetical protein M9932_16105 [Xanthobacteraceae bacterium]|nr:hypothetical protein [Xanthobacteraceae bacterium]